jgi:hypothetical protein
MLTRLQVHSVDHFGYSSDQITWSHVGTLEHYAEPLERITGSACSHGATKTPWHASPFKEGEHTK